MISSARANGMFAGGGPRASSIRIDLDGDAPQMGEHALQQALAGAEPDNRNVRSNWTGGE